MIEVEIAYAEPERQWLFAITLAEGATVADALADSAVKSRLAHVDLAAAPVGIFSSRVIQPALHVLRAGDRIEIYRPLVADPKEIRRQRAERAKAKR